MTAATTPLGERLFAVALEWGLLKSLHNKSFCLSGTMSVPRKFLEDLITELGGTAHHSVLSHTQYLIVPSHQYLAGVGSRKVQRANELGKMVISEDEFCELILPTVSELLGGTDEVNRGTT